MDSASKSREFFPVMSGLVALVGVIRSLLSSTESDDISGDPWSLLFPVAGQLLRDVLYHCFIDGIFEVCPILFNCMI